MPGVELPERDTAVGAAPTALFALFRSALTLTGRRDLGLEFGCEVRPDAFDALGYALMTCRDLGEAIALVPLYGRVMLHWVTAKPGSVSKTAMPGWRGWSCPQRPTVNCWPNH